MMSLQKISVVTCSMDICSALQGGVCVLTAQVTERESEVLMWCKLRWYWSGIKGVIASSRLPVEFGPLSCKQMLKILFPYFISKHLK